MDTTTYLAKLLSVKTGPGGVPFIKKRYLEIIQNNILVDNPELIFHIAVSANEPMIVEYILDRYELDPNSNSIAETSQITHSPYMNAMMFECYDVINIFLQRHLFPDNWYLMFLFNKIYETSVFQQIISDYGNYISLQIEEINKLLTMYEGNTKITEFLKTKKQNYETQNRR